MHSRHRSPSRLAFVALAVGLTLGATACSGDRSSQEGWGPPGEDAGESADGAGPGCDPTPICDGEGCRLPVEPPGTVEQTFEVRFEHGEPPEDWKGRLSVEPSKLPGEGTPRLSFQIGASFGGPKASGGPTGRKKSLFVYPGVYELSWRGWPLPLREDSEFQQDSSPMSLPAGETVGIVADEPELSTWAGEIRFEGELLDERFPRSSAEGIGRDWTITLYEPATNRSIHFLEGEFGEPMFRREVLPATYDVYLMLGQGPESIDEPEIGAASGADLLVAEGVDMTGDREFDVSVRTVRLHGELSVDGASLDELAETERDSKLIFVDSSSGERFTEPLNGRANYETWLYPGTYDVYLRPSSRAHEDDLAVAEGVTIERDRRFDIELETGSIRILPQWKGGPAVERFDDGESGQIGLKPANEEEFGETYWAEFGAEHGKRAVFEHVSPGTYDVWGELPIDVDGQVLLEEDVTVAASDNGLERIAFETVDVPVTVRVGGEDVGGADGESGPYLEFQPVRYRGEPGYRHKALWFRPPEADGRLTIYQGVYDVQLRRSEPDAYTKDAVPERIWLRQGWSAIRGGGLDVDLETPKVSGRVAWNGMPVGAAESDGEAWRLRFARRDGRHDYVRRFGGGASSYETTLYPGVYDVYFSFAGEGVVADQPGSMGVRVGRCVEIR